MFGKRDKMNKPTIKIIDKGPASPTTESANSPAHGSLIKVHGKERLTMPSPVEAVAAEHRQSPKKSGRNNVPPTGITVNIGPGIDGKFGVTATSSFFPGRTEKTQLTIPFTEKYLTQAIRYLRRNVHSSTERRIVIGDEPDNHETTSEPISVEAFGQRLFDSLFNDGIKGIYVDSIEEATAQFPISLICHEPSVSRLPWEFMHDGLRFVCTEIGPIFRLLPHAPKLAADTRLSEPLRLLIVAMNPIGTVAMGWEQEVESIRELLKGSSAEISVVGSINKFQGELLCPRPPQIVHFIAHGIANQLQFSSETGEAIGIRKTLSGWLANAPEPPRLVLFNACDTAGLAEDLIRNRIPLAVGMQFAISDSAARAFAKGFYQYARTGLPLHRATAWGRLSIQAVLGEDNEDNCEWATPTLYVNPETVALS